MSASTREAAEAGTTSEGAALEGRPGQDDDRTLGVRALAAFGAGPGRVLVGLVLIWTIFALANSRFLSAGNLTNLTLQVAAVATISIGVVLVLLLGEIDLSAAAVSGLAGAMMAVLSAQHGVAAVPAIAIALATGAAVGLLQGLVITRFGVPSFVVGLAGLLGWQGAMLLLLGESGTVNVLDPTITGITGTFYDPVVGWVIGIGALGAWIGGELLSRRYRERHELAVGSARSLVVRIVAAAVAVVAVLLVFSADRGVPLVVLIVLALVAGFDYMLRRTTFGRHIFAIGGSAQAAQRAGISVNRVRLAVFVLGSTLAAAGGLLAASRLLAVNQSTGQGDLLLNAIAGPVIAGTSLFGGRGSAWSALLGALVIGSIANGMDLLAFESSVKFMVTGAVLLLAVIVDSVSRKEEVAST